MNADQTSRNLVSLGTVFHKAVIESQAAIDAIPEDVNVFDEANIIELAIEPVEALAQLIMRVKCRTSADRAIQARAQAWMDGNYWNTMEAVA